MHVDLHIAMYTRKFYLYLFGHSEVQAALSEAGNQVQTRCKAIAKITIKGTI